MNDIMMSQSVGLPSVLSKSHVFMKNPALVRQKINQLIKDGASRLQVVSDFDKTITKYSHLGKKVPSTNHIIESHSSIPKEIRSEFVDMQTRYRGVELDRRMSIEEKIPHMIDWAQNGANLFVKAKVRRGSLPQMVQDSHVYLRDGFNHLVEILHDFNIPLLIFSAGLGDILEEVLRQSSCVTPHMKCVANYLEFDDDDQFSGLKGDLIHTFNKSGKFVQDDLEWVQKTQNRKNVILLGDMIGDITMADGFVDPNNSLNIGFLNCNYEELLDTYLDHFDIVLENDHTMDVANAIIAEIVKG